MALYAIEIKKADLALITLLNDGVAPEIKRDTYLVFEITEDAREITTNIVTKREFDQTYEIGARSPFVVRLKK